MTPLLHKHATISELDIGDPVFIGELSYSVEKIATGGMGKVFLLSKAGGMQDEQWSSVHGSEVALKTILSGSEDERAIAMFHRELAVWAAFRHENIVMLNEILDGGKDGWVAAMDRCAGSLRGVIDRVKRVPLTEAVRILDQIISGLAYAFQKDGVLHLDLKPENILYTRLLSWRKNAPESHLRRFKISDWGIASIKQDQLDKLIGIPRGDATWVDTFNNMGTILYMAPERFSTGCHRSLQSAPPRVTSKCTTPEAGFCGRLSDWIWQGGWRFGERRISRGCSP